MIGLWLVAADINGFKNRFRKGEYIKKDERDINNLTKEDGEKKWGV